MRKPLRASTFCFFTRVVYSDDQSIERWSNEVTADMAHALRGEVRESLIGADAIARKKPGTIFRAGSTTHPAPQNPRRLENGYVRMPEGPDLGVRCWNGSRSKRIPLQFCELHQIAYVDTQI